MNGGLALAILGVLLLVLGSVSLYVSKRTGEVHSLWFGKHPENIVRFERAYLYVGLASVAVGLLVTMLGAGSVIKSMLLF